MAETKQKPEEPKVAGYAYLTHPKGSYASAGLDVPAGRVVPVNEAQKRFLDRDGVPVKVAKTKADAEKALKGVFASNRKSEK